MTREDDIRRVSERLARSLDDKMSQGPHVAEDLLWAYELDLLEGEERDAVMQLIAASERAQEELEGIRKALAAAREPSVAQRAKSKGAEIWQGLANKKMVLCAVVVRVGEELLAPFLSQGWRLVPCAAALTLGSKTGERPAEEQAAVERPSRTQQFRAPDGTEVLVRAVPGDKYEVQVMLPEAESTGRVQFRQLIPEGASFRERNIGMPQAKRPAVLSPCPAGVLKIICPGATYVIALESISEANEDEKDVED